MLRTFRLRKTCARCQDAGGRQIVCKSWQSIVYLRLQETYPLELNTPFVLYDHGHAAKRTSVFTEMSKLSMRIMPPM